MLSEQDRAEIFRQCLEALEQGHSTVEQCIARYPEIPDLREMLDISQTARRISPPVMSAARKQALRNQLTTQMKARKPVVLLPRLSQWGRWAVFVPACLLLIFVSGATLLYAADSALPHDPLYGLKRTSEQFGLALARPQTRTYILAQTAQTRLTELVILMESGQTIEPGFFNDVTSSLNAAMAANPDVGIRTALYNQADSVLQVMIVRQINPDYINSLKAAVGVIALPTPSPTPTLTATVPSTTPTLTYTPLVTATPTPSATQTAMPRPPATKTAAGSVIITPYIPPTFTPFMTFTPVSVFTSEPTVTPPSNDVRQQITACVKDEGVQNSLLVKLNSNQLRSLINELAAQTGKKIDASCAARLIQLTTALLTDPTGTPDPANVNEHKPVDSNCPGKGNTSKAC
jgi:hypothetical protein